MPSKVYVIGVGMTKFEKPGKRDDFDYPDMAREAATKALLDANINYDDVKQAFVGYCYGDSTCGQRALYPLGLTQIPIINVNNNCSTGSSALFMAKQMVESGLVDCAMALGFEKMARGSLTSAWTDRTNPLEEHLTTISAKTDLDFQIPIAPQIFGLAGIEYCEKKIGLKDVESQKKVLSKIAWKNHLHSTKNPYSQFRDEYSLEQVQKSRKVFGPLTMLQCCPTSDGSACAIVASEEFVKKHNLGPQAIEIGAMVLKTDGRSAFPGMFDAANGKPSDIVESAVSFSEVAGYSMTSTAAKEAYRLANITPANVQVIELHDCFSANELITYDALGLCPDGSNAGDLVESGANMGKELKGRRYVINPSGGLISKGHPLGATGLAQCAELTWQLRQWCGSRQVPQIQNALQHNIGLGGAVVVSIYRRPTTSFSSQGWQDPRERFGYNPAVECRGVSDEMVQKVKSRKTLMAAGGKARL
ncbi:lipid-transfer protein [Paraphysoderma sedebokerense]|nr:lipid-transfer protein [Paraphysoderma sedebokerense]